MLMNSRAELRWEIFQRTLKGVKGRDGADSCLFSEAEESAALTVAQSRNSAVFSFPFANQKLQFLSPLLFFFFFACTMDYVLFPNTGFGQVAEVGVGGSGGAEEAVAVW